MAYWEPDLGLLKRNMQGHNVKVLMHFFFRRRNIMDHMMAMMEKHQNNLEQLVDERTMALNEEKKRVETLLHRMLPE